MLGWFCQQNAQNRSILIQTCQKSGANINTQNKIWFLRGIIFLIGIAVGRYTGPRYFISSDTSISRVELPNMGSWCGLIWVMVSRSWIFENLKCDLLLIFFHYLFMNYPFGVERGTYPMLMPCFGFWDRLYLFVFFWVGCVPLPKHGRVVTGEGSRRFKIEAPWQKEPWNTFLPWLGRLGLENVFLTGNCRADSIFLHISMKRQRFCYSIPQATSGCCWLVDSNGFGTHDAGLKLPPRLTSLNLVPRIHWFDPV